MELALPFGTKKITFELPVPPGNLAIARRCPVPQEGKWEDLATRALELPIGAPPLSKAPVRNKVVAILVDPLVQAAAAQVLPALLAQLEEAGVGEANVIACAGDGAAVDQMPPVKGLGAPIIRHDPVASECRFLGFSALGTPIFVNKILVDADYRIAVGAVQPHVWRGYTGGYDAILPGAASAESIARSLALTFSGNSSCGRLDDNPARLDLDYIGASVGLNFGINFVLRLDGQPVAAFAGDPLRGHRAAVNHGDRMVWGAELGRPADAAIASPGELPTAPGPEGGPPVEIPFDNRTLDFVAAGVKPRGTIVLLAGRGSMPVPDDEWELELHGKTIAELPVLFGKRDWSDDAPRILARLQAIAAAYHARRPFFTRNVYLVGGELPEQEVDRLGAIQADSIAEAIADVLEAHGTDAHYALVPDAATTLCMAEFH